MGLITDVLILLLGYYVLLFLVGQKLKNNSIVDIGWGLGFVLVAWLSAWRGTGNPAGTVIVVLVTLWGLRLSWHIGKRNIGKGEDYRYVQMREKWGERYPRLKAFGQVYLLQGVLLMIIALPIYTSHMYTSPSLNVWGVLGLVVWVAGFVFEAVGDAQLRAFLRNPENKGKIMQSGLWRYTRHPNYFGESTMWWGLYLITLNLMPFYVSLASPLVITYLLVFVSGVPLTEKAFEGNAAFEEYAKVTSRFFPWFPKRKNRA